MHRRRGSIGISCMTKPDARRRGGSDERRWQSTRARARAAATRARDGSSRRARAPAGAHGALDSRGSGGGGGCRRGLATAAGARRSLTTLAVRPLRLARDERGRRQRNGCEPLYGDVRRTVGADTVRTHRCRPDAQSVVAKIPRAQLIAPGFAGVPVSIGTTVNVLNFIAGLLKSKIGRPVVGSTPRRTPVACKARNVDWSAWFSPGDCPGGSPEAFLQTHPTISGWMVASADVEMIPATRAAVRSATTLRTNWSLRRRIKAVPRFSPRGLGAASAAKARHAGAAHDRNQLRGPLSSGLRLQHRAQFPRSSRTPRQRNAPPSSPLPYRDGRIRTAGLLLPK